MNGKDLNSHDFPEVYKALGININKLGIVMLDTQKIPVTSLVPEEFAGDLYLARDPEKYWIRGAVAEKGAHITLLYGLLQHGTKYADQLNAVLDGWEIPDLEVESIGIFDSPTPDTEPYKCIVAHIKPSQGLFDGRARVELLPHINTFVTYRPHLTLAYVDDDADIDAWVSALSEKLVGTRLNVTQINYGSEHK